METVLSIIAGLLLLTILVVAHEFGHFIVGKKSGIGITEFSAGFGPKLVSKVKNGIRYSLRALPLGGFVQFVGEDEDRPQDPRAFNNRPIWQRFLTILAGPFANIVLAFLITIFVLTVFGDMAPFVYSVSEGMPAAEESILPGDRIVEIDGHRIDFSMEFSTDMISKFEGDELPISVERGGKEISFHVPFTTDEETGGRIIGISYYYNRYTLGFFDAIAKAFKWMFLIVTEMFSFLGNLFFRGQGVSDLAGPVGTITIIGEAVRSGIEVVLRIAALLSINLAVVNLLPFPALDGGRLVFLVIEKIRGKSLPREKEGYINFAGLIVLFILMALLTYQDIARLITG